jgi:hypothetical protein
MQKPKVSKSDLEALLQDEHLSEWFKTALKESLARDPFEACLDAELLYNALKARCRGIEDRILNRED